MAKGDAFSGGKGTEKAIVIKSAAGKDGVVCPAAGAFKQNTGPSSAKHITVPMGNEHEDSVGNPSCFDPNNYEKTVC